MNRMTEEEADALDKYYTEHDIMPDLTKPGYLEAKYGLNARLAPEMPGTVVKLVKGNRDLIFNGTQETGERELAAAANA